MIWMPFAHAVNDLSNARGERGWMGGNMGCFCSSSLFYTPYEREVVLLVIPEIELAFGVVKLT